MIGKKEKIEQFKRDCRSMKFLTKKLIETNNELEALAYKMQGVSGISTEKARCENAGYNDNRLALMEQEQELIDKRNEYSGRINRVNRILAKINPAITMIITDLYINGKGSDEVAAQYSMSKPKMYRDMEKALEPFL